ncbi:putative DNA polymerase epsilon subunit B [Blattamonas nauphoetae]|uniref:DNA polymerase II subunit 2 n=1 Tax=Blattamonas nauphoetae TaxID=2049346 RepID=A0ABQ9Y2V0_9EUKA|nr:putative DNA polymerase epsilon subunit B [Blattamonas nauphoetae]
MSDLYLSLPHRTKDGREKRVFPAKVRLWEISKSAENSTLRIANRILTADALEHLTNYVSDQQNPSTAFEMLKDKVLEISGNTITKETAEKATDLLIQEMGGHSQHDDSSFIEFQSCLSFPRFLYHESRKRYFHSFNKYSLLQSESMIHQFYTQRYLMTYNRIMHHEAFQKPLLSLISSKTTNFNEIVQVNSLLGTFGRKTLFGFLHRTSVSPPIFALEDLTGTIELDITRLIRVGAGFFCEGSLVIIDGEKQTNGKFLVYTIRGPPTESKSKTLRDSPDLKDSWRSPNEKERKPLDSITFHELQTRRKTSQGMFVVLCDVHLDQPSVLQKLNYLLNGYEEVASDTPIFFILCGSFTSLSFAHNLGEDERYRDLWVTFAKIVQGHKYIHKTASFLIIPGAKDPTPFSNCLPRLPISDYYLEPLKSAGINFTAGTNPTRITVYDVKMLIYADNLIAKLHHFSFPQFDAATFETSNSKTPQVSSRIRATPSAQSSVVETPSTSEMLKDDETSEGNPTNLDEEGMDGELDGLHPTQMDGDEELTDVERDRLLSVKMMVRTILTQGTLSPLPVTIQPVLWDLALTSLALYPFPDVIVFGDTWGMFQIPGNEQDPMIVNPGSFSHTNKFYVYMIDTNQWENSMLLMEEK